MSSRAHVYAAVAAVVALVIPVAGRAMVKGTFTVNGGVPVVAGTQAQAVCTAYQDGTFIKDTPKTADFSGAGTFSPATAAPFALTDSVSGLYTATSSWTAPAAAGTYSVTCTAYGSRYGAAAPLANTINVQVDAPAAQAPTINSITGADGVVVADGTISVGAEASDPAGLALSYSWTATGGALGDPAAKTTSWTAPSLPGSFTLAVTVTNSAGVSATGSVVVNTVLAAFQGGLPAPLRYPRRLAAASTGDLLAIDDLGGLFLLTRRGDTKGSIAGLGATAVTIGMIDGAEAAFVATRKRGILRVSPVTGRVLGTIPWRSSANVGGLAWDATQRRLWLALAEANMAVALSTDGTQVAGIAQAEGRPLRNLADVALDASSGTLWVAEKDGLTGNRVHAYSSSDASYLRSMVTAGSDLGQVSDTGGLGVGSGGRVFVSDAFGGTVQVMSSTGTAIGTIGSKADVSGGPVAPGALLQPRGLAFMANGDLAVANSWFNRIERFGTGAALPSCAGDTDCDGLPDDWELAHGLNPNDASDAALDSDGDGLTNLEEYRLGTDPQKADTDGDGVPDGDELPRGRDPLNGGDGRPSLVASNLGDVPPGLVRLNAVLSNASDCAASWRQTAGAKVALRDGSGFTPSFVARTPGTYRFEAIATCAGGASASAAASATVVNVPPFADAGQRIVTAPNRSVLLQAGYSSDANGDTLTYRWDQVAGPAIGMAARGAALTVRPVTEGRYAYKLSATDRAGARGETTIDLVVVDGEIPTAIVGRAVVSAVVGETVTLDASASVPADATFTWQQVEPASAAVVGGATAAFTPAAPGRYVFEVTATAGGVSSPPARVVVLAGALPVAAAVAPVAGVVNGPFTLEATASGGAGGYLYSWRQVAGPAAGLTGATAATATVVAFSPGSYAFELTVTDSAGAVSAPTTVRVDVTSASKPLPAANASAPATAVVSEIVLLDGRASTAAAHYRWSQVAGPWVAIDPNSATPIFQPPRAGTYSFELVVDDGTTRSAPASVTVTVE